MPSSYPISCNGFSVKVASWQDFWLTAIDFVQLRQPNRRAKSLGLIKDRIRGLIWTLGLQGLPTLLRHQLYELKILPVLEDSHANRRVPDFDWGKTYAWVQSISGGIAGYADILVDNSLTQEEFDELKTDLQEVRDPATGQQLAAQVHCEDVFGDGPFLPRERHLLVIANDGISLQRDLAVFINSYCDCSHGFL